MKLELKYLTPYLPYKLKITFEGEDIEHELVGLDITDCGIKLISEYEDYGTASFDLAKPILRPLSDLTKEIEHNGEKFFPYAELRLPLDLAINMDYNNINNFPHKVITKMCEWHFDVFGLIEKGLAIDINSIGNVS